MESFEDHNKNFSWHLILNHPFSKTKEMPKDSIDHLCSKHYKRDMFVNSGYQTYLAFNQEDNILFHTSPIPITPDSRWDDVDEKIKNYTIKRGI